MPPSCPYAVFTPDDCLSVGGHFYTAPYLGSTLRGLRLQEDYPDIYNEDPRADFYDFLRSFLRTGVKSALLYSRPISYPPLLCFWIAWMRRL